SDVADVVAVLEGPHGLALAQILKPRPVPVPLKDPSTRWTDQYVTLMTWAVQAMLELETALASRILYVLKWFREEEVIHPSPTVEVAQFSSLWETRVYGYCKEFGVGLPLEVGLFPKATPEHMCEAFVDLWAE